MARRSQSGVLDLRDHSWTGFDVSQFGEREAAKMRRAIAALLASEEVRDATYRVLNFGDYISANSIENLPEASWLQAAYIAAIALDKLPD